MAKNNPVEPSFSGHLKKNSTSVSKFSSCFCICGDTFLSFPDGFVGEKSVKSVKSTVAFYATIKNDKTENKKHKKNNLSLY